MTKEKFNVHKALCELKLLDSRIDKRIGETTFSYANKKNNNVVSGVPIERVNEKIRSDYQSITDMMRRRDAIKRAVVRSNAVTTVTIAGKVYTVVEAIDMKNVVIPMRQDLLSRLSSCFSTAQKEVERRNGPSLEERADAYIKEVYGKGDTKGISDEIEKARKGFIDSMSYTVVDPLDSMKIIDELEREISDFMAEVDSALSVSNAVTEIEVEY